MGSFLFAIILEMTGEDFTSEEILIERLFNTGEHDVAEEQQQINRGNIPDRWVELRHHETWRSAWLGIT